MQKDESKMSIISLIIYVSIVIVILMHIANFWLER
ncbi:hypothetical protein SAMN05444274_102189 [Mariniphaga anaerophila]|uniref:Uncharacterized protein n=1 Tax=Mariniphaga anaerophila TaxID=1484053 RepID=A0A1M4VRQ0_9BACT|nr:hypothetical protein SAMN05444274_102189 [Mariniphaga anaerophila]